jgi:hypothetical protein
MILSMLYDVNFIIGLLITIVLVTVVAFYFSQRIEDQSEKISAVSVVVQAIAGELGELKRRVSNVNVAPFVERQVQEPPIELSECDNIDLIAVSDDEDEDDDEGVNQNVKSILIGGSCDNDIILNEVMSESGSELESDSESDSESDEDDEDSESIEELEVENVEELKEEKKFDLREEEEICATMNILEELEDLGGEDVKTVNVSLEEETIDYKKMTISKLRSIVIEKQLSQDASKLKKNEIFKLLGLEQ